ncbi:MAG: tetratricopeptide repeat protein [Gammaproteobacteria bacterium]|nr:tetratricopeptide repeat protein [Gammaproteobacteria bacterium]
MCKLTVKVLAVMLLSSGSLAATLDEAAVLIAAGSHQAALERLADGPASARARLLRATALAGLRRDDEAEVLYLQLIEELPRDPAPYNNLAALYAADGRLQEASELLTRAMKSDPRYAAIYKNLSRVYVEMSSNSYARALRMSEQQQGLQLLPLDYHEAPATPSPPPRSPSGDEAIAALKQWAAAWSAQDVEGYLAAYDATYRPPRGLTLAQWQAQRRLRLRKPGVIEVALEGFEVSSGDGGALLVKAVQRYHSDHYRDLTRKGFVLLSRDGAWKIGDEYTIEVLE